eukprot:scaffold5157_cov100-Cylindrotheca_fusiformis.AAC.2
MSGDWEQWFAIFFEFQEQDLQQCKTHRCNNLATHIPYTDWDFVKTLYTALYRNFAIDLLVQFYKCQATTRFSACELTSANYQLRDTSCPSSCVVAAMFSQLNDNSFK